MVNHMVHKSYLSKAVTIKGKRADSCSSLEDVTKFSAPAKN